MSKTNNNELIFIDLKSNRNKIIKTKMISTTQITTTNIIQKDVRNKKRMNSYFLKGIWMRMMVTSLLECM